VGIYAAGHCAAMLYGCKYLNSSKMQSGVAPEENFLYCQGRALRIEGVLVPVRYLETPVLRLLVEDLAA
jgi:hypothetical protein